jgi:hypothetical protein
VKTLLPAWLRRGPRHCATLSASPACLQFILHAETVSKKLNRDKGPARPASSRAGKRLIVPWTPGLTLGHKRVAAHAVAKTCGMILPSAAVLMPAAHAFCAIADFREFGPFGRPLGRGRGFPAR